MTLLWLSVSTLVALFALRIFVWPMVLYGPGIVRHWQGSAEVKATAAALATVCLALMMLPLANAALISGASHAQIMATHFMGLSWSI